MPEATPTPHSWLITDRAGYSWNACCIRTFSSLKAKFNQLPGLNGAVPTQVTGGAGIIAS